MSSVSSRPLRSVLYVPAANERAMSKARQLDCDAVVFDLEDAVLPGMKARARKCLAEAFSGGPLSHLETVIRVNAVDTHEFALDMDVVAQCRPDAVLLPKVDGPQALALLGSACQARGLAGALSVWAMVETPGALLELDRIVQAGINSEPRLNCLVVGTNDLAKETGVFPGDGRTFLVPYLMQALLVARRHGVRIVDGVWNKFGDIAGFEAEAVQGMRMGFDGKTLIHPAQVNFANQAFSPSEAALAEARSIVEAFALLEHSQAGVIDLEGRMVERLHLSQAEHLLGVDAAIRSRRAPSAS